jgi:hypothetical protein
VEYRNGYLHTLLCMSQTIGASDLEASTKHLLTKKCMKMGSKHHYSDADGDYLGCSYFWRGAILAGDAHRRVCGSLNFETQDAKRKLVVLAENEQLKRQRTTEQKKKTVTRKRERLLRIIDREGSLCEYSEDEGTF